MKLLLVRLSAMGDVLHTLPALEVLRAAAPDAELTWAVEALAAPLLQGHPALDRVVVLDRKAVQESGSRLQGLRGLGRGMGKLRAGRFDAALDLQGLLRSATVARLSGAKRVFGPAWAREGARFLYTDKLDVPRPEDAHAVDRYAVIVREALSALGIETQVGPLPPARLPAFASTDVEGQRLVLLPGAGKPANRPPPALLAAVADRCVEEHADLDVVVLGGPRDVHLSRAVAQRCRTASATVRTDAALLETASLLASASAVVGGDTGPLHLARVLQRPLVGLFHAAEPFRTGPAGLPGDAPTHVFPGRASCAPCRARECERADKVRVCLDDMPANDVADAVLSLLEPTGSSS